MLTELRREAADGPASRALFAEYLALVAERLGPGFQPEERIFATEDAFAAPGAAWLVLYEDGRAVGCGGLRPLGAQVAEVKRMYVAASARGRGHGRRLLAEIEALAVRGGHARVRLITTEALVEARALYRSAGYRVVQAEREGGRRDLWMEKELAGPGG